MSITLGGGNMSLPASLVCHGHQQCNTVTHCLQVVPEMSITLGGGNMSLPASLVRQAASLTFAGGDVVGALMRGADPMEIFTKSLLNINVNEIMNFVPQVSTRSLCGVSIWVLGLSHMCVSTWLAA
jgi:hypothetical protein